MEVSTNARVFAAKNAIVIILICHLPSLGIAQTSSKLRVCVVAPRDSSMSVARQCSDLAASENAMAVCDDPAPDRLTCLRRVMNGHADLTVLQAEDLLVAARHISEDITVINELRALEKQRYEYEVAAVVRNSANITSVGRLRNSTFCHPGYGYETDWNGIVSRFLESRVVPQRCDPDLTLAENSLNSAAQFWHAACKAGQWVPDPDLDAELKSRYSSLCAICDTPRDCSSLDKYWGRNGPLVCLTDGAGDVLWARLDHIKLHFAPEDPDSVAEGDMSEYSFLCSNGSLQPLEVIQAKKPHPCVWISRPWPVVVAHRTRAGEARELVHSLARAEPDTWQSSLSLLVAPLSQHIHSIPTANSIEERLASAVGWLNAATVNPCMLGALSTPRMCVTGRQVETKCQWLTEAARAHGIRGAPICVMPKEDCLADVASGVADLASIHPDLLYTAITKHGLKVLLYEQPRTPNEMYLVSAVVTNPNLRKLEDLKGKRACFPTYNGASWQLTLAALKVKKQVPERCDSDEKSLLSYFSSVCVAHNSSKLTSSVPLCSEQPYKGDELDAASADLAALRCLAEGRGDVAFVSNGTVQLVESKAGPSWSHHLKMKDFRYACFLNQRQGCQLGWAPHGMLVTRNSEQGANVRQWRTMFEQLDDFFGPRQHSPISSMLIYGPFDNKANLLFHGSTQQLVDYETLSQDTGSFALDLVQVIRDRHFSCPSLATHPAVSLGVLILVGLLAML